ncbi:hypothetical protein ATK30_6048 [Amycolatopsis echigonensis]|uniref:Uncharacterized protein n=1 Tax=Amycolatopsis echigonensis TaxID=2576905 RepID=A0A2N3WMQ7_9PSEU|nr:hypothetical protein [Amycolatopsis niigatensis]PKV95144.1 hypothetical protein ATK30_6048 [Amycolatopsis niigatensis]
MTIVPDVSHVRSRCALSWATVAAGYAENSDGSGLAVKRSTNGYLGIAGTTPPAAADSSEGDSLPGRIDRLAVESA